MQQRLKTFLLLVLMLVAAGGAYALRPTQKLVERATQIDLQSLVPHTFGDWRVDESVLPISVTPDVQEKLDVLYSQLVNRTYVNSKGRRVMLSIAYGADQSGDASQVHRPEFCYRAQGFDLLSSRDDELMTPFGALPVRRLTARINSRHEPITYWVTVGDSVTLPGFGRKFAQLRYGLTGVVPDGLLFRVSSISDETASAYQLQDQFVADLLRSASAQLRAKLIGRLVV